MLAPSNIAPSAEGHTDNVAGLTGTPNTTGSTGMLANSASQYTVFFAADHGDVDTLGNSYVLGDCSAFTPLAKDEGDWMKDGDISAAVNHAAADPMQPPYNFVYLHTCDSGCSDKFNQDFGIPDNCSDRGAIGFNSSQALGIPNTPATPDGYTEDGELAVSAQNTLFTKTLWQQLLSGKTANNAIQNAVYITGGAEEYYEPPNPDGIGYLGKPNSESATLFAGAYTAFTLANAVYGGSPNQWFK